MSMADPIAIGVETLRIDSVCSLEKEFSELICMNPWMVLYLTFNQVDSCHGCICDPLTWDTKDILWMDDRILIMTYESLVTRYLGYDMKSTKMIVWSRWDHPPSVFEEIDSKEGDAMKSLAKVVEISEKEFPMISTRISTNLVIDNMQS